MQGGERRRERERRHDKIGAMGERDWERGRSVGVRKRTSRGAGIDSERQLRWRMGNKVGQGGAGIKVESGESLHYCSNRHC